MTAPTSAPAPAGASGARIADNEITIERPNGVKAARALAELRGASHIVKSLTAAYGEFVRDYEAAHAIDLDRTQARLHYPRVPLLDPETRLPIRDPETNDVVTAPSPIDAMTEADWEAAGHKLRRPKSPDKFEVWASLAPLAVELAEDRVYRLMALFVESNADVLEHRRAGDLDAWLEDRALDLLGRMYADELIGLAVVIGETVDHHFRRKAGEYGDRLGNALRLFGLGPSRPTASPSPSATPSTSPDTPPTSNTTSPTDSPASSAGSPTTPSPSPGTDSEPSAPASTPRSPDSEPSRPPSEPRPPA